MSCCRSNSMEKSICIFCLFIDVWNGRGCYAILKNMDVFCRCLIHSKYLPNKSKALQGDGDSIFPLEKHVSRDL